MARKCFTAEEAANIVASIDSDDEFSPELVVLPPENTGSVTETEDIDEDNLGQAEVRDVPGELEIHTNRDITQDYVVPKKKKKTKLPEWSQGINISDISENMPDPLEESHPLLIEKSPFDLFTLFFDNRIIDLCVEQTNKYALQKGNRNFSVTKDEICVFLGIVLLSGYHSLPNEKLYWWNDEDVSVPAAFERMSRNRFQQI